MTTADLPPVITSPDITNELSRFGARLGGNAQALGTLAAGVRAEMPDRLILVKPGELVTLAGAGEIPATEERAKIAIHRHWGRYTTDLKLSGFVATDATGVRPNDLVIVTPGLSSSALTESTATALRNHPYLNRVVRRDERVREWLDRWVGLGGLITGLTVGLGGEYANQREVPHTGWLGVAGGVIFAAAIATVTWTRNAPPRRAPMPDLDQAEPPLSLLSADGVPFYRR